MINFIETVSRRNTVLSGVTLAMTVFASPALSANTITEQINECARVVSPASRLQCYDNLSKSLQSNSKTVGSQHDPVTAAATTGGTQQATAVAAVKPPGPKVKKEKRKKKTLFGSKDDRPPDVKLTLIEAKRDSQRRWLFYFDNGQVWRQTERGYVSIPEGDAVPATLSEGFLGSRNLRLGDNKKFVKVKRVD